MNVDTSTDSSGGMWLASTQQTGNPAQPPSGACVSAGARVRARTHACSRTRTQANAKARTRTHAHAYAPCPHTLNPPHCARELSAQDSSIAYGSLAYRHVSVGRAENPATLHELAPDHTTQ
eukprot:2099708-Pleurochrysis_carterae.AAC.2